MLEPADSLEPHLSRLLYEQNTQQKMEEGLFGQFGRAVLISALIPNLLVNNMQQRFPSDESSHVFQKYRRDVVCR